MASRDSHLCLFKLFRSNDDLAAGASVGISTLAGTGGGGAGLALSACSSSSSWMLRFLNACGMRLTRISRRVRRPCACMAYCARSLRARSVTVTREYECARHGLGVGCLLSSWRLSTSACFCACVIPATTSVGFRSGACECACSSALFDMVAVVGGGREGMVSLEVDARVGFARLGGILVLVMLNELEFCGMLCAYVVSFRVYAWLSYTQDVLTTQS